MSIVKVHDLRARALLRLGRTAQVDALTPFPVRSPLDLWSFARRPWVHGAADLGAGFGFGGESNLLKRLKMGLLDEGADQSLIDSMTEDDADQDANGVTVSKKGAAKLPAPLALRLRSPERPITLTKGYTVQAARAQKLAADKDAKRSAAFEDTGIGDVASLFILLPTDGGDIRRTVTIPPPIVITHISANADLINVTDEFDTLEMGVSPPGIFLTGATRDGGTQISHALNQGGSISHACRVPVTSQHTLLQGRLTGTGGMGPRTLSILVAYNRLRRKAT